MSLLQAVQSSRGDNSGTTSSSGSSLLKAVRTSRGEITSPKKKTGPVQFNLDNPLLKRTAPAKVPEPITQVGRLVRMVPTPIRPKPSIQQGLGVFQADLLNKQGLAKRSGDNKLADKYAKQLVPILEAQKPESTIGQQISAWAIAGTRRKVLKAGADATSALTTIIDFTKSIFERAEGGEVPERKVSGDIVKSLTKKEVVTPEPLTFVEEELSMLSKNPDKPLDPKSAIFDVLVAPIKKWSDEANPTNPTFMDAVAGGFGSMGAYMLLSAATEFGSGSMAIIETMSESGSVYSDNRNQGKSIAESARAADQDFMANLIINYATNKYGGIFEGGEKTIKTVLGSASSESIQEGFQQLASNATTGRPLMEGVLESMGVGGVVGGSIKVALPSGQTVELTGEVTKEEKKDEPTKVGDVVTMKVDDLVTHEDAVDKNQVEIYKEEINAGGKPALIVVKEGDKFAVEDGKHKLEAYKQLGIVEVPTVEKAVVKEVTIPDGLNELAESTADYKNAEEFVTDWMTSKTFPEEAKSLIESNYEGETFSDKLEAFYNQAKTIETPTPIEEGAQGGLGDKDLVFHGTTQARVNQIKNSGGLKTSETISKTRDAKDGGIFFSKSLERTEGFAKTKGGNQGVVLATKNKGFGKDLDIDFISKKDVPTEDIIALGKDGKWYALEDYDVIDQVGKTPLSPSQGVKAKLKVTPKKVVVDTTATKAVTSKNIANVKDVKDVRSTLKKIRKESQNLITEIEGRAVLAQEQRSGLNTKDIGLLKRIYSRSTKFQEGDVETIRDSKSKDLVNRVIENVQEKNTQMSEQEAFDFAINLPTKADESATRTAEVRELKKKEKSLNKFLKDLKEKQKSLDVEVDNALTKEWETALAKQEELHRIIETSRSQVPVGEGKVKVSRLEARVKKALGDLSEEQRKEMGLATFNEMNKKENIKKASKYVSENPEDALRVLEGKIDAPEGILRNSILIAMQNLNTKDLDIATRLASLQSTRAGQEISVLTEVNKNLPVNILSDIIKVRTKAVEKRFGGRSANKIVKSKVKSGKSMIKAPKVAEWSDIMKGVRC
jgi:hypothetical protein